MYGPFCAQCGQETVIGVPTLRELGHEYIQTFVTLEGRLWRTLWLLIRWPGRLTTEFLEGRRRRYVRPLPLYLSLSFIFFVAFGFSTPELVQLDETAGKGQITIAGGRDATRAWEDAIVVDGEVPSWVKPVIATYQQAVHRFRQDPHGSLKKLTAAFLAKMPIAVFFMVPLFALGTKLLYRRRQRAYTEHLLFALHFHAFAFLVMLAAHLAPGTGAGGWFVWVWWGYLALALRNVFGGRVWPQAGRALFLLMAHGTLLALVMALVAALVLPTLS